MDKVFREKDLTAITHKEFNEFIKGKVLQEEIITN